MNHIIFSNVDPNIHGIINPHESHLQSPSTKEGFCDSLQTFSKFQYPQESFDSSSFSRERPHNQSDFADSTTSGSSHPVAANEDYEGDTEWTPEKNLPVLENNRSPTFNFHHPLESLDGFEKQGEMLDENHQSRQQTMHLPEKETPTAFNFHKPHDTSNKFQYPTESSKWFGEGEDSSNYKTCAEVCDKGLGEASASIWRPRPQPATAVEHFDWRLPVSYSDITQTDFDSVGDFLD